MAELPGMVTKIGDILFVLFYYTILPFLLNGATLGKLMVGIKVISADYKKVSFWQLLFRNVFLLNSIGSLFLDTETLVDTTEGLHIEQVANQALLAMLLGTLFFVLFLVIFIMIIATQDERGLHDLIARTIVVDKNFDLDSINQPSILERKDMEWAVFEDMPSDVDSESRQEDQIRILSDDD